VTILSSDDSFFLAFCQTSSRQTVEGELTSNLINRSIIPSQTLPATSGHPSTNPKMFLTYVSITNSFSLL
jgi:hypothetical protein